MTREVTGNNVHSERRKVHARWVCALALAWALLIVYGSLIPFRLRGSVTQFDGFGAFIDLLTTMFASPRLQLTFKNPYSSLGNPNWLNDVLLNVALYVPLGALLRAHGRLAGRSPRVQLLRAIVCVGVLSYLVECVQSLTVGRFATINDMAMNVTGALLGASVMPWLYRRFKQSVFVSYTRIAHRLHRGAEFVSRQRRRPLVLFAVAMLDVALVTLWYAKSVASVDSTGGVNWLPFAAQFERSYDVAMLAIGRSIIVYCLLGLLLSLPLLQMRQRHAMGVVVLGIALLAAVREVLGMIAWGRGADVTEPLLAAMAGGMILAAGWMLLHAVRSSCRRKHNQPVAVERRRRRHVYGG